MRRRAQRAFAGLAGLAFAVTLGAVQATGQEDTEDTMTDRHPAFSERVEERRALAESWQSRWGAPTVTNETVIEAIATVPRHAFVPLGSQSVAYADSPLSIGEGQTISQPYIVALMTQMADLQPGCRVLEIGTGSGYQAAVLGEICDEVYSIEIIESLSESAGEVLTELGYDNVHLRVGDGYVGWEEEAPFDAVLLTAAPPEVPQPLLDQVALGGVLVAPVGPDGGTQELVRYLRDAETGELNREPGISVRFVPMTGEAQY